MVDDIKLELPPGYKKIFRTPQILREYLKEGLEAGMPVWKRIAQLEYLSGPRPQFLAPVTGALRAGILWNVMTKGKHLLIGSLGLPKPGGGHIWYGRLHELGIGGMPQRAFLRPSRSKAIPTILRYLDKAVHKGFKAAGGTRKK